MEHNVDPCVSRPDKSRTRMARMCAYVRQQFPHPTLPRPTILHPALPHPTLKPYNPIITSMTLITFVLLLVSWWLVRCLFI